MLLLTTRRVGWSAALLVALFVSEISVGHAGSTPRSLFSVTGEPPEGFASNGELGLSVLTGNTKSGLFRLSDLASYRFTEETVQLQGSYLKSKANGTQNAMQWSLGARYERRLMRRLGGFLGQFVESDRFAGYRQRYASDAGLRRTLWSGDRSQGAGESGIRFQRENRTSNERLDSLLARFYFESSFRIRTDLTALYTLELLPSLRVARDWMLNTDLAIQSAISERFALKTAYGIRYDNLPAGPTIKQLDTTLSTSLVAKF
ncbi:MAG: DUF481 domain-containing protein [Proteobacteria bacterium]|nr:MAG: DUF481 domain-containing protein [Pseudomonadota bacterium]